MMLNGDIGALVFQADFEDVDVRDGGFDFFREVSGLTATKSRVEVQNNAGSVGPASQGNNLLELDGTNGVFVEIENVPPQGLILQVNYSARPKVSSAQNAIEVLWNGELVSTLSADGTNLSRTDFRTVKVRLPVEAGASLASGRLEFRSPFARAPVGRGGLLDNIRVSEQLRPLAIRNIADQDLAVDDSLNLTASLRAPNEQLPVTWSLVDPPAGLTIDQTTGQISWTASRENIDNTPPPETMTMVGDPVLVFQSGFEEVNVESGGFAFFEAVSGFTSSRGRVEVQDNPAAVGAASEGRQHVELDGVGSLFRDFETVAGDQYELQFDFSARPGVNANGNAIEVWFDGKRIDSVTADGSGQRGTAFETFTYDLSGFTGDLSRLEFRSNHRGNDRGRAGLIDNVKVFRREVEIITPPEDKLKVTVRATDSRGRSDTETFNICIDHTVVEPSAPVLANIANQTVDEGDLLNVFLSATDLDTPTDQLRFELVGGPDGMTVDATTGQLTWTPTEVQGPGEYLVRVRVVDETSLASGQTFSVTVAEVNQAPVIDAIEDQQIADGESVSLTVAATDADLPVNTLVYSIQSGPNGATIDASTGQFAFTPTNAQTPGVFDVVGGGR